MAQIVEPSVDWNTDGAAGVARLPVALRAIPAVAQEVQACVRRNYNCVTTIALTHITSLARPALTKVIKLAVLRDHDLEARVATLLISLDALPVSL